MNKELSKEEKAERREKILKKVSIAVAAVAVIAGILMQIAFVAVMVYIGGGMF